MAKSTPSTVDSPEARQKAFMDGLNDAAISANTLSSNIEFFDYIFNEYRSNDWGLEKLNTYLALIADHAEKVEKVCDSLIGLYAAVHPLNPTVVAMEYANSHKSVVRVFLSDNNILMQRADTIRAIDLHVNDKVIHCGESLWPVIDARAGNTVPFPDCIGD